jgi:hydroxymethylbilane synthase
MVQARLIERALLERDPQLEIEIVSLTTTGDRRSDGRLAAIGGKGLFLKELEEALLAGAVDFAVHSMKDVPAVLPDGLVLAGVPARVDPRDVLVGSGGTGIAELEPAARVGTASTRRRAQLLVRRPDLDVRVVRGNVQTRLRKLAEREVDVLVLAAAGLERLGLGAVDALPLEPGDLLPAVGQGALALEYRATDAAVAARLGGLADAAATVAVAAERGFLVGLGGDCTTPLAAYAEVREAEVWLRGEVLDVDGKRVLGESGVGPREDAEGLGRRLADALLARGAGELLGR